MHQIKKGNPGYYLGDKKRGVVVFKTNWVKN